MQRIERKTPVDIHGVYLAEQGEGSLYFSYKDWDEFYETCAYCFQQYFDKGLIPFEDNVLQVLLSTRTRTSQS